MIWIILCGALFFGSVSCGTEYLLDLALKPPYNETTDVYLGQKLQLVTTATFADGQTTEGVSIELMPSVGTPSVFAISKIISYTKGSQLETDDTTLASDSNLETHPNIGYHKGPDYVDSTLKQRYDTRAELNIGKVRSLGPGANEADNQIVIEFEAVYVSIGDNSDGDEYMVSVGEIYDNGTYIWISQIGLTLNDEAVEPGVDIVDPTFDVNTGADENIAVGIPKTVELTMNIAHPAANLNVESAVVNLTADDIFVMEMNLKSVGEAYSFSMVKENIKTVGYETCPLSNALILDLGFAVNKEAKEDSPNTSTYPLVVETTYLVENPALVGNVYNFAYGISIGSTEIWVGDFHLTVVDGGSWTPFSTFTATVISDTISPGFSDGVEILLTLPRQTNWDYNFDLSTRAVTAAGNALSILTITPMRHGNNIPCDIPNSAVDVQLTESVPDSAIFDGATWSTNISNPGMQPIENLTADSDQYLFTAYVMMSPDATPGETFMLDVNVNGVGVQSIQFTTDSVQDYPTDVNYTFSLECDSAVLVGSKAAFKMTVETQPSITAGGMTIEYPIPENVTSSYLTFKSGSVTLKGSNVATVPLGEIPTVVSDWDDNSGRNDRGVLNIPLVGSTGIVNGTAANEFVVEAMVELNDDPTFLAEDTTGIAEFGIGASISDKLWVASCVFNTKAPIDLTTTKRISGVIIPDGQGPTTWPGDLKVQWSADNVMYNDYSYTFQPGVTVNSATTYGLDPPLYARYARLINTNGGGFTNYSFEHTDIEEDILFFGSNSSKEIMLSKIMFVLDNDVNTCMTLPTPDTNDTAKYYWSTIKTQTLGADGQSPFNLLITGKGLTCNNKKAPQVTMAMHPKDSSTLKFTGNRKKCKFIEETGGDPMSCKYTCNCTDSVTCADVSLLLYYRESPVGAYEMCDVKVVP